MGIDSEHNACQHREQCRENKARALSKEQAAELAIDIAERLWDERKLSYAWDPRKDIAWLAEAIYEGKLP